MSDPGIIIGGEDGVDLTAAEYALGVLDGHDYTRARDRVASDAHFAREVALWEDRLAGLIDEVAEAAPSPAMWPRIERRVQGAGNVVDLQLRRRLSRWRMSAGMATAVAASLALALMWPKPPPPPRPVLAAPAPVLTARLAGPSGPPAFVAVLDPNRHEIVLTPAAIAVSPGRSPELWLVPAKGKPISLGVGTFDHAVRLKPSVAVGADTLAVSIEPLGGSPTGQATGPIVAIGKLERI